MPLMAVEVKEDTSDTIHFVETRVSAEFTKEFRHGLSLGLEEEIRARVFETDQKAYFRGSYTTLHFGYEPIQFQTQFCQNCMIQTCKRLVKP